MSQPLTNKPWSASDCVEWIYERAEGDIVVYARTAIEALEAIYDNGFRCPSADVLIRGDSELTDILKREELL